MPGNIRKLSTLEELKEWLRNEARYQLQGCTRLAHDGTRIYLPDGKGMYGAMWPRDFSYMVENAGDLIPQSDIRAAINFILNNQREDGCIPDRVQENGSAIYEAGPAGFPVGDSPTDNSQFIVKLMADYVNQANDYDFFNEYSEQLIAAMDYIPRSSSGLVYIDPAVRRSPYGFTDTINKTGELLFSSLLYWEASVKLSKLFRDVGDIIQGDDFSGRALMVENNIDRLWDEDIGMFHAATIDCRQIDIWGNAYSLYIGFPVAEKKNRIVDYLADNFEKFIYRGQVRHLPSPQYWDKTLIPVKPEKYMNGAYWGTASGWVAYSLFEKCPELGLRIFTDLVTDYQENGIYECINNEYDKIKNYVVSVVNPYGAIKKIEMKN